MEGFINVDIRDHVNPDIVANIALIDGRFAEVDLIYACHVLEHFPAEPFKGQPYTFKHVLYNWYNALKAGGILRLAVPDMTQVTQYLIQTGDIKSLQAFFHGGLKNEYDIHYHSWTWDTLCYDLMNVGFRKILKYDWRKTEHSDIDDYSQCYLPHMDKENGRLMSLNVEATK
jgi:predicted SAM-dependent methyltransferase